MRSPRIGPRMLWTNPALMLRLLALLILTEAAHYGFFVTALPLRGDALGLNAALIGTLVGAHYLADALSKGPMGYLAERFGAGRVLALASLAGLLTLLLTEWGARHGSLPYAALFALAVLWGVLYASLWPSVLGYSQLLAQPSKSARALALTSLSVAPSALAGIAVLGPLIQRDAVSGVNVLLAIQAAALLLSLTLLHLKPVAQAGTRPASLRELKEQWGGVGLLMPAALAQTLAPGLLFTLIFPLLQRFHLTLPDLLLPGLGAGAGLGLALWLAGRVADSVSPRRVLLPGLLLLTLSYGLLALPDPPRLLWAALPLLGAGYGAFITGWNGLVGRALPGEQRMTGWGAIMTVEALGYAIGPFIGGIMWTHFGHSGVFAVGSLVFVLALGYYLFAVGGAAETGEKGQKAGGPPRPNTLK